MNSQNISSSPKVRSLQPDTLTLAKAYYNRGNAYNQKGEYDRAIEDYAKAIELKPHDANTYYNRGIAYYSKDDFISAICRFHQSNRTQTS